MKNTKKESGISALSIVFYVVAVIFLLIAVDGIYKGYRTVESYKLQYTMTFLDIIGLYFDACAQYFAYAFTLYGIGAVLGKINVLHNVLGDCAEESVENKEVVENIVEEPIKKVTKKATTLKKTTKKAGKKKETTKEEASEA